MINTLLSIKDHAFDFIMTLKPIGIEPYLLSAGAVLGIGISVAVGGLDQSIYALLAMVIVDYFSGMYASLKLKQWDSSIGFRGLCKKFVIFAIVALCNCFDMAANTHFLRQMAICAYTLNEFGSIIENIDRMGYGSIIPNCLRNALARLESTVEKGEKIK